MMDVDNDTNEPQIYDEYGRPLVKLILTHGDGSAGEAMVLEDEAQKILNGELQISLDHENSIILMPQEPHHHHHHNNHNNNDGTALVVDDIQSGHHQQQQQQQYVDYDEDVENSQHVHINSASVHDLLANMQKDRSNSMTQYRPTMLQKEQLQTLRNTVDKMCVDGDVGQRSKVRRRKPFGIEPYSQKYGTQSDYQEMLSLQDYAISKDELSSELELCERYEFLRKHAMIYRHGANSKVHTISEQAINEAAALISRYCPALLFHSRDLALQAKQAIKKSGIDFHCNRNVSNYFTPISSTTAPMAATKLEGEAAAGLSLDVGEVADAVNDEELLKLREEMTSNMELVAAASAHHPNEHKSVVKSEPPKTATITSVNDLSDNEVDVSVPTTRIPQALHSKVEGSSEPPLLEEEEEAPDIEEEVLALSQQQHQHKATTFSIPTYAHNERVIVKGNIELVGSEVNIIKANAIKIFSKLVNNMPSAKQRHELSVVENYVYQDANKIIAMNNAQLEDQIDFIRNTSIINGRYASGPINKAIVLSKFDLVVNEAAAWLVRYCPSLLHHFDKLTEFAKQIANDIGFSAASIRKYTSNSDRKSSSNAAANNNNNNALNSSQRVYGGYSGSNDYYNNYLSYGADSHRPFYTDAQLDEMARNYGNSSADMADGGAGYLPFLESEMLLDMMCEEEDIVLDKAEILRLSGCKYLSEVKSIKVPCCGYTKINVEHLVECVQLLELDLEENALSHFPKHLHLPCLTRLRISGNRFSAAPPPLIEQFPRLRHITVDEKFHQRLNFQLLGYFCPNIRSINDQVRDHRLNDYTARLIQEESQTFEPHIRTRWENDFCERFQGAITRYERIQVLVMLVADIMKTKKPLFEETNSNRDLLVYRFVSEYVRIQIGNNEFSALLCGGVSEEQLNEYAKEGEQEWESRGEGEHALFTSADEVLGYNCPPGYEQQLALLGIDNPESGAAIDFDFGALEQLYTNATGQSISAQPPPLHIGRSLRQGRSVVATIVQPKAIVGKPLAEFLPGELRNKDYVKGHVASEIYKKAVKEQLGGGGGTVAKRGQVLKMRQPEGASLKRELQQYDMATYVSQKKREFMSTNLDDFNNGLAVEEEDVGEVLLTPYGIPNPMLATNHGMNSRLYRRKRSKKRGSLRNLGSAGAIDYDPLHFIRCHARDNDTKDCETKVWRCSFEPNPNNSEETTHIVATCGGECVCLINCETGKVMKRFKHAQEEFTCLTWTTVETDKNNRKCNLLAAAGKLQEIRLLHPDQLMCYAEMRGHTEDITALTFHQTSPTILFSGDSKAAILVWDIGIPQATSTEFKTRYSLLMRLRCPRLDVNPVLNLVFMPEFEYLIAGCEDGMFSWRLSELRSEKREREPDMELRFDTNDEISLDGLAQLNESALVVKGIEKGSLIIFDLGSLLDRRKGLQKSIPVDIHGYLEWANTDEIYINVSVRQNMSAVLCGDHQGAIWIYDLEPYIDNMPVNSRQPFNVTPIKILEWPECSMQGNDDDAGGFRNPVINAVEMSSDGEYIVAVTDNNLVCIWRFIKLQLQSC